MYAPAINWSVTKIFYSSSCPWTSSVSAITVLAASAASATTLATFSATPSPSFVSASGAGGGSTPLMPSSSVSKTILSLSVLSRYPERGRGSWDRGVILKVEPAGMGPMARCPYPYSGGIVKVLFNGPG